MDDLSIYIASTQTIFAWYCFFISHRATLTTGHRKTPPDGITCDPNEDINLRCSLPSWGQSYSFSGDLRPALLSPKRIMPKSIRRPDYAVSILFTLKYYIYK